MIFPEDEERIGLVVLDLLLVTAKPSPECPPREIIARPGGFPGREEGPAALADFPARGPSNG